jgi:hypothetical protein
MEYEKLLIEWLQTWPGKPPRGGIPIYNSFGCYTLAAIYRAKIIKYKHKIMTNCSECGPS